jgi:hypothetical protein
VPLTRELQLDAVVGEALTPEALSGARLDQEVDDSLLDHACTNTRFDVLAAPVLEDHRVDALQMEQVAERESRWARADDPPACAWLPVAFSSRRVGRSRRPLAAGTPQ